MIEYILLFLFLLYILLLVYLHYNSPFWFYQPVYHTFTIYPKTFGYWSTPYIIKNIQKIKPNLFCDFVHIQTAFYSDIDALQKQQMLDLLQSHCLDTEEFLYDITIHVLDTHLNGQKFPTIVSFYFPETVEEHRNPKKHFLLKPKLEKTPIACFTTNQQYIWFPQFKNDITKKPLQFPIYKWDYICVHRDYKEKHISRNMIQTHLYNQYKLSPIEACIFKKDVVLCKDIVPLVLYDTYTFFIQKTPISKLPIGYKIKRIEARTINAWVELYTQIPYYHWDVCLLPSLSNTLQCIEKETHYVILLIKVVDGQETVKGVYIFKDQYTVWDNTNMSQTNSKRTIQCVSSICLDVSATLYFFRGFLHSIKELYYQKKDYGVLTIEQNSHNDIILERWKEKYSMHMKTPTAYYLYNMVYPKGPVPGRTFFTFD